MAGEGDARLSTGLNYSCYRDDSHGVGEKDVPQT